MSTIFTARQPRTGQDAVLMAAPIDFGVGNDESLVTFWSDPEYFDVDALVDAFGNCPATFLQASFQMMKPVQNYYQQVPHLLRQDGRRPVRRELLRDGEVDRTTISRSPARPSASSSRSCTSATSWSRASSSWATSRWT